MGDRYPLAPFFAASGWTMTQVREVSPCNGDEYRVRLTRGVTERLADRLAVAADLHPGEVWPDFLSDEQVEFRACLADDCDELFEVTQEHRRYCSSTCSSRHRRRVRYRTDPVYREQRKLDDRAHYLANGDEVRERTRQAKAAARARRKAAA